jgi:hypothetical protein
MEVSGDDLAGVVDIFGGLTRDELGRALSELAFKRGVECEPSAFAEEIDAAIENYELIRLEAGGDGTVLVAGPSAFPSHPESGEDLRHILDVEPREIDRERSGRAAAERLREEAASAIDAGDTESAAALIDVSYDIEAWAPVDLAETRARLDSVS